MEMHDDEKKQTEHDENLDDKDMKKSFKKKLEKKDEEIKRLQIENEHFKNEYFRAYADMKNLRRDLEKDHQEAIKYRAEGFIEGLLPILDSFYLALESNKPTNPDVVNYLVGFQYIYKNLVGVLENEGVKEIAPSVGDKFDPQTMNAIETTYDEGEENIIKKVYGRGYMLHNRVIRPAMVNVSTHQQKEENKEDNNDKVSTGDAQ